jgi:ubiquinone/menaquinone biosynthesis C-methylase UbiE
MWPSSRYDRSIFQPLFFRRVHQRVLEALRPTAGERILDVGCGTGKLAALIASAAGSRVDGVDAAPGMVAQAVENHGGRRLAFAVASAEALPYPDGLFDAAVTAISAHHWEDAAKGFAELARVVRIGGRVVVADVGSLGPVVELMRRMQVVDPNHHPGWDPRELGDLLYAAGFRSVRTRTARVMGGAVVLVAARR